MSKKQGRRRSGDDVVIAPGGPRARKTVHAVGPHDAVDMAAAGGPEGAVQAGALTLTPGGFRPRSFVHRVESGHLLQVAEGQIRVMDRAQRQVLLVPRRIVQPSVVPALGSGWISYAYWNNGTGNTLTSFRTSWRVPPSPSAGTTQTIFLFNGIQNYGANYGILQPVLQWGPSAAGGGAYWSIASWYVTTGGDAFHTPLVQVNAGDLLVGVMRLTGRSGTAFSYTSEFEGRAGTSLPVQNIAELLWCNETLEAYGVNQCTNYPNTQSTAMDAIEIRTGDATPPVSWTGVNAVTDCNQHVVVVANSGTNGRVDIHYRRQRSRFEELNLVSAVTDPILLWLFRHGWEDPDWGRRDAVGQAVRTLALLDMAGEIEDPELQQSLRKSSAGVLKRIAERLERGK